MLHADYGTLGYNPGMQFNHAMVYCRNVGKSMEFYCDQLGFELLEQYLVTEIGPVYARLKSPDGDTTIALHMLNVSEPLHTGGIRLYFEVRNLDAVCKRLAKKGVVFTKPPTVMPWGWKHAYLNDPDGHEVSLYWAGAKRLKKSPHN